MAEFQKVWCITKTTVLTVFRPGNAVCPREGTAAERYLSLRQPANKAGKRNVLPQIWSPPLGGTMLCCT
eukprot:1788823-Amphidinium_carterae.1